MDYWNVTDRQTVGRLEQQRLRPTTTASASASESAVCTHWRRCPKETTVLALFRQDRKRDRETCEGKTDRQTFSCPVFVPLFWVFVHYILLAAAITTPRTDFQTRRFSYIFHTEIDTEMHTEYMRDSFFILFSNGYPCPALVLSLSLRIRRRRRSLVHPLCLSPAQRPRRVV